MVEPNVQAPVLERTLGEAIVGVERVGFVRDAAHADVGDRLADFHFRDIANEGEIAVPGVGGLELPALRGEVEEQELREQRRGSEVTKRLEAEELAVGDGLGRLVEQDF